MFAKLFRSRRAPVRRPVRTPLRLEPLEDRAVPATVSWNPVILSGAWETAANWSPAVVPGAGDDVIINARNSIINLSTTRVVQSLQFSDGTVRSTTTGHLTISGLFSWDGGRYDGNGSLSANGDTAISGGDEKFLSGPTLTTAGTVTWTGAGLLRTERSTWNTPGTVRIETNQSLVHAGGGFVVINNTGTWNKVSGVGTTNVGAIFNNAGTVNVLSGGLSFNGGGESTGDFNGSAGAVLGFGGAFNVHNLHPASRINAAAVQFTGNFSTRNVAGGYTAEQTEITEGTVNFQSSASSATTILEGGTLGGTGSYTTSGLFTWAGGRMADELSVVADGDMTILGGDEKFLAGPTLTTAGTVTWTGSGLFRTERSTWNTPGTVRIETNQSIVHAGGGFAVINNTGTWIKASGDGTTTVQAIFNNQGTVEVAGGGLNLRAGGSSTGTFHVEAGLNLRFTEQTHTLIDARFTGAGLPHIDGGTVVVQGTVTATDFALDSGILEGDGTLSASGVFEWTGGTMRNPNGVTDVTTLQISGNFNKTLDNRTLNLVGNTLWTGSGDLNLTGGATINNLASGFFEIANDRTVLGSGTISNAGVFYKGGGVGTTSFTGGVAFRNDGGYVALYSGVLSFAGAYTQNAGTTEVIFGTDLVAAGGVQLHDGTLALTGGINGNVNIGLVTGSGVLAGTGTILGNVDNNGVIDIGGVGAAGLLTVTGTYRQRALGVLNVELGGTADDQYDQLRVVGAATLDAGSTLNVSLLGGFVPVLGDRFEVLRYSSQTGMFTTITGLTLGGGRSLDPRYEKLALALVTV